MVLDDSGERFHELDHFGLPALDESLAYGFLEILVEFSHAKTINLERFSVEKAAEISKNIDILAQDSCARPPPWGGGVSGVYSVKVNIFPRISVKVAL